MVSGDQDEAVVLHTGGLRVSNSGEATDTLSGDTRPGAHDRIMKIVYVTLTYNNPTYSLHAKY